MNRRKFVKKTGVCVISIPYFSSFLSSCASNNDYQNLKNWIWINTNLKITPEEWKKRFADMRACGIDAILPQVYNGRKAFYESKHVPVGEKWLETIMPLAKVEGLEVHGWMWCMICNIESIHKEHPEWFSVNRNGESSIEKPAYVGYYNFLCPSRAEVHEYLQNIVSELAQVDELDGIHFDYIRHPDVILPEALQPKYDIIQDKEYPEYDYCYCESCRSKFEALSGIDPLNIEDPSQNMEWRQFRQDLITHIVNDKLVPIAKKSAKTVTAAVFPNWEMVRQEWYKWNLDGFLPMLYHNFYNEDLNWIKEQLEKANRSVKNNAPIYSGLYVPELSPGNLGEAIRSSVDGGAQGVSLFSAGAMTEDHWEVLNFLL